MHVLEVFTLPLTPRLLRGPSWPAWGPGPLVAAVPLAPFVLAPGDARPVVIAVAVGLAVGAQVWPLAGVLAVGAVLLGVGARREQLPAAFFGVRLADLR